ncbi:hypothetical protein ACMFMF_004550 [Clarireedia jacksonii]
MGCGLQLSSMEFPVHPTPVLAIYEKVLRTTTFAYSYNILVLVTDVVAYDSGVSEGYPTPCQDPPGDGIARAVSRYLMTFPKIDVAPSFEKLLADFYWH